MAVYTVFGQSGSGTLNSDTSDTNCLGMQFTLSQNAALTGIWFCSVATAGRLPSSVCLYQVTGSGTGTQVTGTVNSSPSWSGAAGSGWVKVTYDGSVTLTAGTNYKVCAVVSSTGLTWYSITSNYWTSGAGGSGIVSGIITAPNNAGADSGQDSFGAGAGNLTYPNSSFNASNYWLDVEVTTAAAPAPAILAARPGATWLRRYRHKAFAPSSFTSGQALNAGAEAATVTAAAPAAAAAGGAQPGAAAARGAVGTGTAGTGTQSAIPARFVPGLAIPGSPGGVSVTSAAQAAIGVLPPPAPVSAAAPAPGTLGGGISVSAGAAAVTAAALAPATAHTAGAAVAAVSVTAVTAVTAVTVTAAAAAAAVTAPAPIAAGGAQPAVAVTGTVASQAIVNTSGSTNAPAGAAAAAALAMGPGPAVTVTAGVAAVAAAGLAAAAGAAKNVTPGAAPAGASALAPSLAVTVAAGAAAVAALGVSVPPVFTDGFLTAADQPRWTLTAGTQRTGGPGG